MRNVLQMGDGGPLELASTLNSDLTTHTIVAATLEHGCKPHACLQKQQRISARNTQQTVHLIQPGGGCCWGSMRMPASTAVPQLLHRKDNLQKNPAAQLAEYK